MLDSLPGKVMSAGFSGLDATEPPNTYQRAAVNAAKSEGVTEGVIELCSLPVELQEVLAPFDANGNGRLEVQELATFSRQFRDVKAGSMPISVFDAEHQEKLRKFDTDGGGHLDADEIVSAFMALHKAVEASSKGTIPFENFPVEMQKKLATLDETGDGQVSLLL